MSSKFYLLSLFYWLSSSKWISKASFVQSLSKRFTFPICIFLIDFHENWQRKCYCKRVGYSSGYNFRISISACKLIFRAHYLISILEKKPRCTFLENAENVTRRRCIPSFLFVSSILRLRSASVSWAADRIDGEIIDGGVVVTLAFKALYSRAHIRGDSISPCYATKSHFPY